VFVQAGKKNDRLCSLRAFFEGSITRLPDDLDQPSQNFHHLDDVEVTTESELWYRANQPISDELPISRERQI